MEQAVTLAEAGVDLLIFETFGDVASLVDVIAAAVEATGLAVIAQMTFLHDCRTARWEYARYGCDGLARAERRGDWSELHARSERHA